MQTPLSNKQIKMKQKERNELKQNKWRKKKETEKNYEPQDKIKLKCYK